jgi:PAS domain S-box-containing protein
MPKTHCMKKPKLHPREHERLKALESLNILDTLSEKEFDEITLIASHICNTPIALISLIDGKRQWFKSKVGLTASETAKDIAFCAHAILQDDVFIVPDSSKDDRFFDNPLATGAPHVQFYAGAPLLDPVKNLPIGTLCVIDNKSRVLDSSQIAILEALSNQIYKLLELRIKCSALAKANEDFVFQRTALDNMSEGVVLQDRSGRIVDYNNAALKVLCLSADQLVGKTSMDPDWFSTRENGSSFPGHEHPAMVALSTGKPQNNVIMGIKTKHQETHWIKINSAPIFLEGASAPSHFVSTFADITNEKTAQQALIQSAKMTSLGEMAGGIAHEINTPLAVISVAANQIGTYLGMQPPNTEKVAYKLEQIESTVQRISQIVRGLRAFSRNSVPDERESCSVKQIISDTVSFCSEKFKAEGINLEIKVTDDFFVSCVPTQVSQIILNLLNNAHDAVEVLSEKWVSIELEGKNNVVYLRVTDSGSGIQPDIVSRMMEPFFTTKEVGKGTGLGLSISKGIAESFNGSVTYSLHRGHTSFVVALPFAEPKSKVGAA